MIPRHRTALSRKTLSRPVRLALADGVITPACTVLDYGCGRGNDVRSLLATGIGCVGWDPTHFPHAARCASDVVNLGYVVNVIEDEAERAATLREAWALSTRALVVSARLKFDVIGQPLRTFSDGCLTSRGTFQKFYDHTELHEWVAQSLGELPVSAAPGVLYVFRERAAREQFLAERCRSPRASSIRLTPEAVLEQFGSQFAELLPFFSKRVRLPSVEEVPAAAELYRTFHNLDTILDALRLGVGPQSYDALVGRRSEELLLYLSISRFDGRPSFAALPPNLRLDVLSHFRSYRDACHRADAALMTLADRAALEAAFQESPVGKLTGNAFYVHVSALESLPFLLRLYEACAREYVGATEGATLVKLHRSQCQVSYLAYPDFDRVAHPPLAGSLMVQLRHRRTRYRDYSAQSNPPILHRKELFVSPDYPRRAVFARLTRQEERLGLLRSASLIGTRDQWIRALTLRKVSIRGHRLEQLPAAQHHVSDLPLTLPPKATAADTGGR